MLDKHSIARALREMGLLLEAKGESPFKIRAYENGARAIEALNTDLGALVDEDRLTDLPGIGEALAKKITELWRDGRSVFLEQLRAEMPRGTIELLRVPDLGPKRIKALHQALGIDSVDDLERACKEGRVRVVKGFSEKLEQKICAGIEAMRTRKERTLLVDARTVGDALAAFLKVEPAVVEVELGGSARRWKETVADLDLVVATTDVAKAMDRFVAFSQVIAVESRGDTKCTVRLLSGLQVDLRAVPPDDWATALHHFTGSKTHHVRLRSRARERGLTISEWGVFTPDGGQRRPVADEAGLYALLDLPFIPPELREDEGEIEAALAGDDFADLLTEADLRGVVHCHSTFSDGRGTIEEMARAAEALGYTYLTITDHSPTASYAGGVTLDKLEAQWAEIDRVQQCVGIRLLKGTESDILESGALDYPDAVLERFDVVIASVHNRYRADGPTMTRRLVRCMELPIFKIWGHGLGRLLEQRPPFDCDVEAVLDALARSKGCVEINGDPHRLDLEPRWAREAKKRGLSFVVSCDAHAVRQFASIRYGVAMARRAGLRCQDVLNTRSADEFLAAVRPANPDERK